MKKIKEWHDNLNYFERMNIAFIVMGIGLFLQVLSLFLRYLA